MDGPKGHISHPDHINQKIDEITISPDSRFVLYTSFDFLTNEGAIFSGSLDRLTPVSRISGIPDGVYTNWKIEKFSNAGDIVIFSSRLIEKNNTHFFSASIDNVSTPILLNQEDLYATFNTQLTFSVDDRYLLYNSDESNIPYTNGGQIIHKLIVDGSSEPTSYLPTYKNDGFFHYNPRFNSAFWHGVDSEDGLSNIFQAKLETDEILNYPGGKLQFGEVLDFQFVPSKNLVVWRGKTETKLSSDLYFTDLNTGEISNINKVHDLNMDFISFQISPDEEWLLFVAKNIPSSRRILYSIRFDGSPPIQLSKRRKFESRFVQIISSGSVRHDFIISEDSKNVLYELEHDAEVVIYTAIDGSTSDTILMGSEKGFINVHSQRIINDGNHAIFSNYESLILANLDTASSITFNNEEMAGYFTEFYVSSDSSNIFAKNVTSGGMLFVFSINYDDLSVSADPLLPNNKIAGNFRYARKIDKVIYDTNISPDSFQLWAINSDGTHDKLLFQDDESTYNYRLTAISSKEKYAVIEAKENVTNLKKQIIIEIDNPEYFQIIDSSYFTFTPSEESLVFISELDNQNVNRLYWISMENGRVENLSGSFSFEGDVRNFSLTPDGEYVIYSANKLGDSQYQLYSVPISGGPSTILNGILGPEQSINRLSSISQISPDGRIMYLADQDIAGLEELYLSRLPERFEMNNYITVVAPSDAVEVDIDFTVYFEDAEPTVFSTTIPANRRFTQNMNLLLGELDQTRYSATVTSDDEVFAERVCYWNPNEIHRGAGYVVPVPKTFSIDHYFAEGSTTSQRETYFYLTNNSDTPAEITVNWYRTNGWRLETHHTVRANRLLVLDAWRFAGEADFSTFIHSANGVPVAAERVMVGPADRTGWHWGNATPSVSQGASEWFFAEGAVHKTFEEFLLFTNLNPFNVTADLEFNFSSGETFLQSVQLPAGVTPLNHQRITFNMERDFFDLLQDNSGFALKITTPENQSIIVERSMYWKADGISERSGSTTLMGIPEEKNSWFFPEGAAWGPSGFECFILLNNATENEAEVRVSLLRDSGEPIIIERTLPAGSRETIKANDFLPQNQGTQSFSTIAESLNDIPIIAERVMYWQGGYHAPRIGGHASTGISLD